MVVHEQAVKDPRVDQVNSVKGKNLYTRLPDLCWVFFYLKGIFFACVCVDVDFHVTELRRVASDMTPRNPCQNVVRFASDGSSILTGGEDGVVRVWKVRVRERVGAHQMMP